MSQHFATCLKKVLYHCILESPKSLKSLTLFTTKEIEKIVLWTKGFSIKWKSAKDCHSSCQSRIKAGGEGTGLLQSLKNFSVSFFLSFLILLPFFGTFTFVVIPRHILDELIDSSQLTIYRSKQLYLGKYHMI